MRWFGKKNSAPVKARFSLPRWIKARFDAAQTTKDNARHWAAAEFLSADAEADPQARKILRTRARYEVQNNSYARGIVSTIANDTVGTGPRLQMLLEGEDANRRIEHDFAVWAKRVHLPAKLRTIRMARCQDGEAFVIMVQNPNLKSNVKLDLQLIEADRVTDDELNADATSVDGITFDPFGNPKSYKVLKNHPGGTASFDLDFKVVKAEDMIHVFRQDRPEQHRGIPEITAALPLFAHLRRFTLAVVSAAEAAADFAGVLRELAGGEDPRVLHQRVRHPRGPGLLRRVPRDRRHRRDGDVQSEVLLQERLRVPEGVELRAGLGDDAPRLRCRARLPRLASELRESLAGHAAPRRVRVPELDAPAAREHAGCPVAHGPGFLEGLRDGRRHRGHLRLRVRPERLGDADVQVGGGGVRRPLLEFGYDRRDVGAADADVQREEFFLESPSRFSATAAASNRAMSFRIPLYLPVSSRTLA